MKQNPKKFIIIFSKHQQAQAPSLASYADVDETFLILATQLSLGLVWGRNIQRHSGFSRSSL